MFVNFLSTLTDNECMFCCTGNECPDVTVHWMTHYVVYGAAAAIREASSWHLKSKLFFTSLCVLWAKLPLVLTATTTTGFLWVRHIRYISTRYQNKSVVFWQIPTWMNRLDVCLLKSQTLLTSEKVMIAWKWASKCVFYFNKLVSCKIRGKKKIYICYVLYMVCIVFVKINQTMFYRKTFLYEDVWKDRKGKRN